MFLGSKAFQVVYYSFERQTGDKIFDDSGNNVDALVSSQAQVTKESGKCGSGLHLYQGRLFVC